MLKQGSTGEQVRCLQRALGRPVTGEFDADLHGHVKSAQLHAGLTPDGIVGPKTWAAIWATYGITQGEPCIHKAPRSRAVAWAVQHHSDTDTVAAMVRALNGKKPKSTHFSVDHLGVKRMHLDPVFWVAWHCVGASLGGIGIDAIHRRGKPFTPAQVAATGQLHRDLAMIFGYPCVAQVGRVVKGKAPGNMGSDGQLIPGGPGVLEHGQIQATRCPDGFPTAAALNGG
jgi:hypothetical protein